MKPHMALHSSWLCSCECILYLGASSMRLLPQCLTSCATPKQAQPPAVSRSADERTSLIDETQHIITNLSQPWGFEKPSWP